MTREEAIKWLKGIQGCYKKKIFDLDLLNGLCVEAIDMAIEALQTERPTGIWDFNTNENNGKSWNICSVCGESIFHAMNFCPYCGADMRGEKE